MNAIDDLYEPRHRKPCPECGYEGCDACDGTGFAPEPQPLIESPTHQQLTKINAMLDGHEPVDPVRATALARMPYDEYLQTPEWRDRRRQAINAAEHRCQNCRRHDLPLQVHHLTYERRGNEHPDDLKVLCERCHAAAHGLDP